MNGDLSPRDREIKTRFCLLVERAGGNRAAVDKVRVNGSRLSDYCSQNNSAMPPADVIADLEAVAGDPFVTTYLAALRGKLLVDKCEAGDSTDLLSHAIRTAKENGDAVAAIAHATQDARHAGPALIEVREAIQALVCAEKDLERLIASSAVPVQFRRA